MKKVTTKLMSMALAVVMAFSLTGCSGGKETTGDNAATPTTAPTKAAEDATEEAPAEEVTEAPEEETYDFGGVTVKAFGGQWNNLDSEDLIYTEAKAFVEQKYNIKLEKAVMEGYDGYNDDDLLIASIAAGDPAAHIITLNPESMVTCFLNDVLYDITDFKDTLEVGSLYTDVASWQGRTYGVSYDNIGDNWVLVYDRKKLEEIGMEKTPTEMFMEGKWDYESFKAYLTEMKSKLEDGVYPIGQYPYHWAVMAASANGAPVVDENGKINYTNEAFIEAMNFYQELEQDGLAYPAKQITKEDGSTGYDYAYAVDDERIILRRAEPWQLGGLGYEYGIAFWPWGSNVTCTGDYTTLSDNYKVAGAYWAFDAVVKAAVDKTGIPGEVLTQIIYDYQVAVSNDGKTWMHDAYVAEQAGNYTQVGAEFGQPRSFYTPEDIELYDWGHARFYADRSWALDSAALMQSWTPFKEIFYDYLDVRSTLESYYNEAVAKMAEVGLEQ
ncbi:MAG: hypothetical protein K0S47_2031 [Herbinix sp.]|nr:hypothetical protein [Herbinix sp.]